MLAAGRLALALVLSFGETAAVAKDPGELYKEAGRLQKAGDLAGAARLYGQAHELLRAGDLDHGNVVDSLFESVNLALDAYGRSPDTRLLCDAKRLVVGYEAAIAARGGKLVPEVAELRDQVTAILTRDGITCQVADAEPPAKPTETTAPAPAEKTPETGVSTDSPVKPPVAGSEGPRAPDPAPPLADRRVRRLRIGGYTSVGVAGVGLVLLTTGAGVGVAAELAGQKSAMNGGSATWLHENAVNRGSVANTLVIVGTVLAATATVTAVALLATSRRKSRMAFRARFSPGGVHF